jgi:crotonobetainyl-CoA:carnitine CoA-transferase CaiB-like acyl-CoA transferase
LRHRDASGEGQHIDVALLDSQVAWLINEGLNYLVSGELPPRRGNAHPNIVPYELFQASDGAVIIAVGNDGQFRRLCEFAGAPELADDPLFATNPARLENRKACVDAVGKLVAKKARDEWVEGLEGLGVPCSPVNDVAQVFEDPQVKAREMKISMPHPLSGTGEVDLIANPLKLSGTPVSYRRPPPFLGQHTFEVLAELLDMDMQEIMELHLKDVL